MIVERPSASRAGLRKGARKAAPRCAPVLMRERAAA
jgi:hypothetical protein